MSGRGDPVVDERRAQRRDHASAVAGRRHIGGEVARHHRCGRHERGGVERHLPRGRALIAGEEEHLVALDRTAHRAAELVPLQAVLLIGEEVRRVEAAVAVELEQRAMEHVGAGAGDRAHRRARAQPARRLLGTGGEPELLERVGERQVQPGAVVHVAVGCAVQRVGDAEVVAAGHRDPDAGVHAVRRRRRGLHGDAGQGDELRDLPRVERQLDDSLRFDHGRHADGARVHQRRRRRHLNLLGHGSDAHDRVDDRVAVHLEHDAGLGEGVEALQRRFQAIGPERKVRQRIRARFIRDGGTRRTSAGVRDRNGDAGEHAAALVAGSAADAAGGLGPREGGSQGQDKGGQ